MLNKETSSLKLLPCGAFKSKIFQMWPREPEKYMKRLIHSIQIETNPHLSEKEAVHRKRLSRREIEKLVEVLGAPKGYHKNQFSEV